jgi:predicted O-methyltransferase YrrM
MFQKVHRYLEQITPERHPVLRQMEQYAKEKGFPIIGPLVGRLLYQMAVLTKAKRILELGSGFGYSAFWFSLAVKGKGHITMTDGNKGNKKRAFQYFKEAGLQSQFDFKVGDALRIARRLDGVFEIVLNDIDKHEYPDTIDLAAAKLRKGGLFITDNVIWKGQVADRRHDDTTAAIVDFNNRLYKDSRFFTTIVPIRDGVSIAVRL